MIGQINAKDINYSSEDFEIISTTLASLMDYVRPGIHIALVGSIANHVQFPEYYSNSENLSGVRNVDLVAQPPLKDVQIVEPTIKNDFYFTYSFPQFENFSLFFTRKPEIDTDGKVKNIDAYTTVNFFIGEKKLRTDAVNLDGKEWQIPTKSEIFMKVCRDIFLFDAKHVTGENAWRLAETHRNMYKYLIEEYKILEKYKSELEELWPEEIGALKANIDFDSINVQRPDIDFKIFEPRMTNFTTLQEYLQLIHKLVSIDDNFVEPTLSSVKPLHEDSRPSIGKQSPFGLDVINSEEFIKMVNAKADFKKA
jgi:hypothetical protein